MFAVFQVGSGDEPAILKQGKKKELLALAEANGVCGPDPQELFVFIFTYSCIDSVYLDYP